MTIYCTLVGIGKAVNYGKDNVMCRQELWVFCECLVNFKVFYIKFVWLIDTEIRSDSLSQITSCFEMLVLKH